ncbi:MAG: glycerate-2-kinase [Candidatus Nitrosomirales archaeon]|jgi:glycerate-2-kinase
MKLIINKNELLHAGTCLRERRLILGALEASLSAADPKLSVKKNVKLKGKTLHIMGIKYSLNNFDSIHVIGSGKASGHMAEALFGILQDRITDGLVIIPENLKTKLQTGKIKLLKASHPIPSHMGVRGVKKMLACVSNLTERDLVICLISGGGSALMPLPYDDLTLENKQEVTSDLLKSGANIYEINAVRKHLSSIKGGRLAEKLQSAHIVSLIISDVIGNRLDTIASGPTVPDRTTYNDVIHVLKKYGLWNSLSVKVKRVIEKGLSGTIPETPKSGSRIFRNVKNFVIADNEQACKAALNQLRSRGIHAILLTTSLQGEARDVGRYVASLAEKTDNRKRKPAALIMGGETTVTVTGKGKGGRNQELVLAASIGISGLRNTVLASLGTDGIDGNSDAAGAIADTFTIKRAERLNLDPQKFLQNNDSYSFFKRLGDTIQTGPTGTNVDDLLILLCMK